MNYFFYLFLFCLAWQYSFSCPGVKSREIRINYNLENTYVWRRLTTLWVLHFSPLLYHCYLDLWLVDQLFFFFFFNFFSFIWIFLSFFLWELGFGFVGLWKIFPHCFDFMNIGQMNNIECIKLFRSENLCLALYHGSIFPIRSFFSFFNSVFTY